MIWKKYWEVKVLVQRYNKYIIYSNLLVKVYFRPHAGCRSLEKEKEKEKRNSSTAVK